MLYTLFYKLLFLLTHIVYLSSSVHIGLDFYTGCIAFSVVDVHKYLTSPSQVDTKGTSILPKAIPVVQSPWPAPHPVPWAQFREEVAGSEGLQVIWVLLPEGPCRWLPFLTARMVGEQGGSARCPH